MKKHFSILLAALLLPAVIFAQQNSSSNDFKKPADNYNNKMVKAGIMDPDLSSSKISPLLNIIINRASTPGFSETDSYLRELAFFYKNPSDEITIPVFIKTSSADIMKTLISQSGGITGTTAGDIITAHLPLSSIKKIAEYSETIYIDVSGISETKTDVSRTEIKVDLLHNGTGISRPYKGNGVIVGVLDSGIDWKHADFKTASGSRINYLWDMSGTGNPPSGYSYGTEYLTAQMNANQCGEVDGDDGHGHGTHVAGTAAGNGRALSNYIGMAPESDIIFVKGFRSGPGFANSDVVDGCNYIFQKAQQLGKPAVINLSLGGHYSSHDGTSLYDQALSNLTGSGKIIVAAAGNEGGEPIHLSYSVAGTSYNNAFETYFELADNASFVAADMWYTGGNISVGIAAYEYSNPLNLIGYTQGVAPGQVIENVPFTVQGTTYAHVTIDATGVNNPNNGSNEVIISIDNNNGQYNINNVYWTIYTYGTGTFDAWALGDGIFSTYAGQSWLKPGDDLKTIGTPGTALKVICVGSYVTKTQWIDINGVTQQQPGNPVMNGISGFSSKGPTRDGRIKPDICAPGEVIIAAYSSFLTQTPPSNIAQGGKHQKMQGTSMASPHVTGTIALLLEKKSTLDYNETVTILKNTTKKDGFTGSSPNNIYGHGKLDALNAFNTTPGGGGGTQVLIIQEGFDASFPPSGWTTQVLNTGSTWTQSNPQNNNFNLIDPASLFSALCPWVAQNQNEWLISTPFSLAAGNASIEFYAGYSTQWLTAATLKLHISTDGGSNWTQLWTADNDGQPWKWRKKIIDLSAYSNKQNLKLGWQYIGNDGDLAALDGIKLLGYLTDTEEEITGLKDYAIEQNYPNPFNPVTNINYSIPFPSNVKLEVFNLLGESVAVLVNGMQNSGSYKITWDALHAPSGVYFYKIHAESIEGEKFFTAAKKMIVIK